MKNPFRKQPVPVAVAHTPATAPTARTTGTVPDDLTAKLCAKLGLPSDAAEDEVMAAIAAVTAKRRPPRHMTEAPEGLALIPTTELEALRHDAGEPQRAADAARDWAILGAISEGRLSPFQARSIATMWAVDQVGAREILTTRPANTVPIEELGHAYTPIGDESDPHAGDDELADRVIRGGGEVR